jgi:predicted DNA-binding ribbon-helix-helix protein
MSGVRKRSVTIRGHRTSFSLEDAFFDIVASMARTSGLSLSAQICLIDQARGRETNLSSALRLAALDWALKAKGAATELARESN